MRRSLQRCVLLATMISLICFPACCATGEKESEVDAIRIHAGWTAPAAGYYLTDAAMRDTIAGWTTAKQEANIREQALTALRDEIKMQQADLRRQLAALQQEITTERKLWRSRVRRGKAQGFVYGVLIGGVAGYLVKKNNP